MEVEKREQQSSDDERLYRDACGRLPFALVETFLFLSFALQAQEAGESVPKCRTEVVQLNVQRRRRQLSIPFRGSETVRGSMRATDVEDVPLPLPQTTHRDTSVRPETSNS